MIAYIPIPNNSIPSQEVVTSLLNQVNEVITIECGDVKAPKDRSRYEDIGKGRIEAMRRAVVSEDEYFVTSNSGALHKDEYGIARCIHFLKKNIDWGGVSLPRHKMHSIDKGHITQECVVYRTEAVKDIDKYIKWDGRTCECAKIKRALKYRGYKFGYLELEPKHIKDIGRGLTLTSTKEAHNESTNKTTTTTTGLRFD